MYFNWNNFLKLSMYDKYYIFHSLSVDKLSTVPYITYLRTHWSRVVPSPHLLLNFDEKIENMRKINPNTWITRQDSKIKKSVGHVLCRVKDSPLLFGRFCTRFVRKRIETKLGSKDFWGYIQLFCITKFDKKFFQFFQ